MNQKVKLFAEQVLVVFILLIAFLLLFEEKLVLPYWIQPVGRMHPLLLHFPIVLLILAMLLDILRFRNSGNTMLVYRNLAQGFLLGGAILSGITVIMGLFLSHEEGYAGDTLSWHKWTGVSIFFMAAAIYWMGKGSWYKAPAAWVSAVVLVFVLVVTGHYGATLSHGEDFIMEPIIANATAPVVPLEQAIVFEHIIQPILVKKCTGCHNIHKLKGELALTDSAGLLKGGKSGKLFVPGNPEISLMMERVHLPLEEKKHMPPSGKPQLTPEEILLLSLWIKSETAFNQKLVALSEEDSLRVAATMVLQPSGSQGEQYDFEAADEKTIAKLNTFYCSITPIARESPALDVSIYNQNAFSVKQLQDLDAIRKQVVSLTLNKMPVKDEDIAVISKFDNLRKLDLNFTDITDKSLAALSTLKHLRILTLSGTKVTYAGLNDKISSFASLKTVALWNTGVTAAEAEQLKQAHSAINFIEGYKDDGKHPLKLNPPQVKNVLMVFGQDLEVQLRHPVKGVEIRFTTDGSEPDSFHAPVFSGNMVIQKNTTVKAKAVKDGWYSSDVISFDFLKNTYIPDSLRLLYKLNEVHLADGANTFFNKKLGAIGANNPAWANFWAGARSRDMGLVAMFNKPVTLSSFGLHYMVQEDNGIYPPGTVEVWGGENEQHCKLLLTLRPPLPKKGELPSLKLAEGTFKAQAVSYLRIIAKPHKEKKDEHLLLVDEMFLN